ncbi:MAG: DUF1365 domain-containing protein [Planctomycetota bacterium]
MGRPENEYDPAARQSCLYEGLVRHARKTPFAHAFRYRVVMAYLDLDEAEGDCLPELTGRRLRAARFDPSDHDPVYKPGRPLSESVRRLAEEQTGRRPEGPVRLLTQLRWWGRYFSPINLYYLFGPSGETAECLVAEVSNTPWNERHYYAQPLDATAQRRWQRFSLQKAFHVSPFMDMESRYDWTVNNPGEKLFTRIDCTTPGGRLFTASMALERRPLTTSTLASAAVRYPATTARILAAIYWQALRLWAKKAPYHPHPQTATP